LAFGPAISGIRSKCIFSHINVWMWVRNVGQSKRPWIAFVKNKTAHPNFVVCSNPVPRSLKSFDLFQHLSTTNTCAMFTSPTFRILVSCAKVVWGHDDSSVYKTSPDRLYNNWQHSSFSTSIHIHLHHCTNISIYIYSHPYHPLMSIWIIILCRSVGSSSRRLALHVLQTPEDQVVTRPGRGEMTTIAIQFGSTHFNLWCRYLPHPSTSYHPMITS